MAPSVSDPRPSPPLSYHSQNYYLLLISFLSSLSFLCVKGSVLPMLADGRGGLLSLPFPAFATVKGTPAISEKSKSESFSIFLFRNNRIAVYVQL
jgi:hypothetical protein